MPTLADILVMSQKQVSAVTNEEIMIRLRKKGNFKWNIISEANTTPLKSALKVKSQEPQYSNYWWGRLYSYTMYPGYFLYR